MSAEPRDWDGCYGDAEADYTDQYRQTRRQTIAARLQSEARARQPKCSVSGCQHRANFGFWGECTNHSLDRIFREAK